MKFLIFGWKEGKSTLRIMENNGPNNIKKI
jgi:hypothetical protein